MKIKVYVICSIYDFDWSVDNVRYLNFKSVSQYNVAKYVVVFDCECIRIPNTYSSMISDVSQNWRTVRISDDRKVWSTR